MPVKVVVVASGEREGERERISSVHSHLNQNTGKQGKPGTTTTIFTGIGTQGGSGIGTLEEFFFRN